MKRICILLCGLIVSAELMAHEGHSHAPGTPRAPHGGVVKDGKALHLEILSSGQSIELYPYSQDMQPISPTQLKIEGYASLPRKKEKTNLKFAVEGEAFKTQFDSKGAHRFQVDVTITPKSGTPEAFNFSVEAN